MPNVKLTKDIKKIKNNINPKIAANNDDVIKNDKQEEKIKNLMNLGNFNKDNVIEALKNNNYDENKAINFLYEGENLNTNELEQ